jgi:hypothetical protein
MLWLMPKKIPLDDGQIHADMIAEPGVARYRHRDGTPYPLK